jgi:hypothetical protein
MALKNTVDDITSRLRTKINTKKETSMNFLHKREHLNQGDIAVVDCSHQCNIMLTDDTNFRKYKSGQQFSYHGGHFKIFPAKIAAPSTGYWNIVLDLGGGSATVKHSISFIRN